MSTDRKRRVPLRYLPQLLASVIRSSPFVALGLLAITLVSSVIPALQLTKVGEITATIEELGRGQAEATDGIGWSLVLTPLVLLVGLILLDTLLSALSPIMETSLRESLSIRTQRQVIEKAQSLDLVYFEHPEFYDRLQRANEDMGGRLVTLLRLGLDLLSGLTGSASLMVLMFAAHWALVPIVTIGVIPGVWVALTMNRRTYWVYRMRTPENRMAMYLRGLLTRREAAKEVRLFTLTEHLTDEWTDLSNHLAAERRSLETKQAVMAGGADVFSSLAYGACITILAYLILGDRISFDQYVVVTPAITHLAGRLESIMRAGASLQEQSLYLGDLYEFLSLDPRAELTDEEPERAVGVVSDTRREAAPAVQVVAEGPLGPIRFEGVSFRYPGSDRFVLKDIHLTLHPGERIALVGENGAGKSTLVRLLLGLYRPTEGRILVGGRDMADLPREYLHERMAAVFQDFVQYLFPVYDNIAMGRLGRATEADVRAAAELAGVAEYIESLPDGYYTQLGREMDGVDLSGGQWQKLAIARALVRRAELIILDEPTAALDPLAEAEIYQQFLEMTSGRTAVIISHRLGSARMAHRIVVLKDGRIVEEGDHDFLVRRDGEYARLFSLQAQWYQ